MSTYGIVAIAALGIGAYMLLRGQGEETGKTGETSLEEMPYSPAFGEYRPPSITYNLGRVNFPGLGGLIPGESKKSSTVSATVNQQPEYDFGFRSGPTYYFGSPTQTKNIYENAVPLGTGMSKKDMFIPQRPVDQYQLPQGSIMNAPLISSSKTISQLPGFPTQGTMPVTSILPETLAGITKKEMK